MLNLHAVIYISGFIGSYALAYHQIMLIPSLVILGWCLFGLTSIGHELYHSNSKPWWGFFFLDLWSVRKGIWIERHNQFHHYHTWEEDEHEHLSEGGHIWNILKTGVVLVQTYRLLEPNIYNVLIMVFRLWFFSRINWWAIGLVYLVNTLCVTYFTFITHAAPVLDNSHKLSHKLAQIHRSVDIFPDNSWFMLLTGAFNLHTVHHLKPSICRDHMTSEHHRLKELHGEEYRVIYTWKQLYNHFNQRHRTFSSVKEWREAIDC